MKKKKKKHFIRETLGPDFIDECYQNFKEHISILYKLFQTLEKEEMLSNSFCRICITLILKADRNTRKKSYRSMSE